MTRPLFIALEGLNAAGKTTTAALLGEVGGIARMPSVPDEYDSVRSRFASLEEMDARFLCFASAVSLAGSRIRRQLAAGLHVVADSYFARAVAFHRGMGSTAQVSLPGLLMPDVTFQLACDPAIRARRLRERGGIRSYWDARAEACSASILREYQAFRPHLIDTTELSTRQVAHEVLRHPIDGTCDCENAQPVAGHQDVLSALPRGAEYTNGEDCMRSRGIGREVRYPARA